MSTQLIELSNTGFRWLKLEPIEYLYRIFSFRMKFKFDSESSLHIKTFALVNIALLIK